MGLHISYPLCRTLGFHVGGVRSAMQDIAFSLFATGADTLQHICTLTQSPQRFILSLFTPRVN